MINEQTPMIPSDMLAAIAECSTRCEEIVDEIGTHADTVRTPPTAYHYTDGPGLFGVLVSGVIRMTDIFGLNDPTELLHGVQRAPEILIAEAAKAHPAAMVFAEKFSAFPDALPSIAHMFVASFSHNGDDLGQWRGYGSNGHGFALGFDNKLLEERFILRQGERITNNSTFSIRYDDEALRAVHQRLIQKVLPLIELPRWRKLDNSTINEFMKQLSIQLSLCVVRAALFFKHPAYQNEAEYRLLHMRPINDPLPDLKLRARGHSLIRFTEFDWHTADQPLLREVVLGPALNEGAARPFVIECLRHAGIDPNGIRIWKSGIPYRG
jgi:hypothetical protein